MANNNWNTPISGLNKDSYALSETDYSHLRNGNFENLDGGVFTLTNEMSNILATRFSAGFKVIGAKNDINTNSTYFFLVNPQTNVGEFGVIKSNQNTNDLADLLTNCEDCGVYHELSEKLEDIEQTELQTYITLLTDVCNWNEGEALNSDVFNFSIHHPIKTAVIKAEKCGKVIYFTDNLNPPRYIQLDNLGEYVFKGNIVCGVDDRIFADEELCPQASSLLMDADKLLIFKKFDIPTLSPSSIILGGNLKMGVYSFLLAYCNELGQEISEYYSLTTPIPIFDENNNILQQEDLAARTNLGIKLDVSGLDQRYEYYKVVVAQTTSLDAATVYYEEGVHPINDTVVTYTTEQNKIITSIGAITKINLKVERTEGLTESNNSLFQYGITNKKEINLQPVVNLLGSLLQWQTHIAKEDLYTNGVNVSKYLGYNRDETVPFGIKFYLKGGYETKVFPFIGRPAFIPPEGSDEPGDKDILVDEEGAPYGDGVGNQDVLSILEKGNCIESGRRERWQFYNTADVDGGFCVGTEIKTKPVNVSEAQICYVEDVAVLNENTILIDIDENYVDFETYVEENQGSCSAFSVVSRHEIAGTIPLSTLNVKVNGADYLMTFTTDISTTIGNFITANQTAIFISTGSTVTQDGNVLDFSSPIPTVTFETLTGDLENINAICSVFSAEYTQDCIGIQALAFTGVGASGDVININGVNYPLGWNTNIETTLAGFISANTSIAMSYEGDTLYFNEPLDGVVFIPSLPDSTLTATDTGLFSSNCKGIEKEELEDALEVSNISYPEGVYETYIEKIFSEDYTKKTPPQICLMYQASDEGGSAWDFEIIDGIPYFKLGFQIGTSDGSILPYYVFKRDSSFNNETCNLAAEIVEVSSPITTVNSYFNNHYVHHNGEFYDLTPLGTAIPPATLIALNYPITAVESIDGKAGSYIYGYINLLQGFEEYLDVEAYTDFTYFPGESMNLLATPNEDILYIDESGYNVANNNPSNYYTKIYYWNANLTSYIVISASKKMFLSKSAVEISNFKSKGFYEGLHKGALWFKGIVQNRDKFIFEVSKEKLASGNDWVNIDKTTITRVSFFDRCSSLEPIASVLVNLSVGEMFLIEKVADKIQITRESLLERTITLTGTGGKANINIGGTNYLATFNLTLTTTASEFVSDYAATIFTATGAVVTSSGSVIKIVDAPNSFPAVSITNVSGDLNGTVSLPAQNKIETGVDWFTQNDFFVTIENKIVPLVIDINPAIYNPDAGDNNIFARWVWLVSPTDGCYSLVNRNIEYKQLELTWNSISLRKKNSYTASCEYFQPIPKDCTAVPFKKGTFAYNESNITYPDNTELFNSAQTSIEENIAELLSDLDSDDEAKFIEYYWDEDLETFKEDGDGKPLADFTCRPIRHFRFPDNKIAPFMQDTQSVAFSSSLIYPLGVTIKEKSINAFLNLAVKAGLMSQDDRDSVFKYEIVRGDLNTDRSVIASGLLYDMREYLEKGKKVMYSNYPYNTYCFDKLNLNLGSEDINPDFGKKGKSFTFHSPETDYYKAGLPTDLSIQGYMFGKSKGHFDEVKEHPKWTILTSKAKNLAKILAGLEVAVQIAVNTANYADVYRVNVGTSSGFNIPGIVMAVAASSIQAINSVVTDYGRLRYEWLKIFRDLGRPSNFASYYYSEGNYNYLKPLQENTQKLRNTQLIKYLNQTRQQTTNEYTGEVVTINNIDREKSVLISLGKNEGGTEFTIDYPSLYKEYDKNTSSASLTFLGENGSLVEEQNGKSAEIIKNIASPYVHLKNYLPSQHGEINTVRWMTTGFGKELTDSTNCISVFGGDTYISRHTLKRKIPLFLTTAMGQASMTPFNYYFYNNIGTNPRFYCSYELNKDFERNSYAFPDIDSDYSFDSLKKVGNYLVPPSKFYLYYYGVPSFLTETRINTNFRYAERTPERQFYPQVGDLGDWTQESKVSIKEPNYFFYNNVYSSGTFYASLANYHNVKNQMFPITYNPDFNNCTTDFPNGVIYSLPDLSENSKTDPWLIYRPLDFYEFPTSYGKLKNLRGIESGAILARFENTSVIYNRVNSTIDDGKNPEAAYIGGGAVFQRRPITSPESEIGFGGTQSAYSLSTEFGHFHVDAKRGQVMFLPAYGESLQEISATLAGRPSFVRHWFKEHLPFKILKSNIQGIEFLDTDNGINGVGIVLGWDSRFRRVFITKKDYVLNTLNEGTSVTYINNQFILTVGEEETEIFLTDSTYFEDVSFTIAFSPLEQKWIGFYDYKPNYYISHHNYFQTGINQTADESELGLWSHLLTNKSYQVFYGKFYPFIVEYNMKRSTGTLSMKNLSWDVDVLRYHDAYDYSDIPNKGFNKLWVYGTRVNTGELRLDPNTGSVALISSYPKTDPNGKFQRVLVTNNKNRYTANYFYDRVVAPRFNTPIWHWDKNQIEKSLNDRVIKFSGKNVLEVLRSNMFYVRLQQDHDSRFRYNLHLAITKTQENEE